MDKLGFVAKANSDRCAILKDRLLADGQATVGGGLLTAGLPRLECVNPECAAQFNFRQGRIFRFYRYHSTGNALSLSQYSLKHFWLCKKCTEIYTLEYQDGTASLIPLAASRPFSAVAYPEASPPREETPLRPVSDKAQEAVVPSNLGTKHGKPKQSMNFSPDVGFLVRGHQ